MNFRLALFSAALHKGKMNAHVILLNRALGCGHQPQKVQGIGRETVGDSHYDPKFGCHSITLPVEAYEKIAKPLAATFGPLRTWEVHFVAEPVPELPAEVQKFLAGYEVGKSGGTIEEGQSTAWNEGVLFGMLFEPNAQAELMIAREGDRMRSEAGELPNSIEFYMLRSVAAMSIAEGEEGWENLPIDCPMLVEVAKLRRWAERMALCLKRARADADDAIIGMTTDMGYHPSLQMMRQAIVNFDSAMDPSKEVHVLLGAVSVAEACNENGEIVHRDPEIDRKTIADYKISAEQADAASAEIESGNLPRGVQSVAECKHEYVQGNSGVFSCMLCGEKMPSKEQSPVDAKTPFFLLRKIAKEEGLDIESADWKDADNAGRAAAIIANRQRKTEHAPLVEATA